MANSVEIGCESGGGSFNENAKTMFNQIGSVGTIYSISSLQTSSRVLVSGLSISGYTWTAVGLRINDNYVVSIGDTSTPSPGGGLIDLYGCSLPIVSTKNSQVTATIAVCNLAVYRPCIGILCYNRYFSEVITGNVAQVVYLLATSYDNLIAQLGGA